MKTTTHGGMPLAKGQVWKTRVAAIEVVALGKRFIHYRVIKLFGRREVSAQISGLGAMENYLRTNAAQLARGVSAN
jgi:hypothetical protein